MKKSIFILLNLLFFVTLSAQEQQPSLLDTIVSDFHKYISLAPQQKIYLQTDKPYYISGEKAWFRLHLTEAHFHRPVTLDRYAYVELINPLDSIVLRLKVRQEDKAFQGHISLPEDLPEGYYKVRAYTSYMRNVGEDYFFTKYIYVGVPQSSFIQTNATFNFDGNKKVSVEIHFRDLENSIPFMPEKLTLRLNKERRKTIKADNENIFRYSFSLPPDTRYRILYAEIEYDNKLYSQYISIPFPEDDFDVSFFPEGGYLLSGVPGKVAFKSTQPNGLHSGVTGKVYDNDEKLITLLSQTHSGMGLFAIVPEPGKTYYAVCENERGVSRRFELPVPKDNICALEANWINDRLWISVKTNRPENPEDVYYLLAHIRGEVCYASVWNRSAKPVSIDKGDLSSGVMHILLLNSELKPVSERLVFIRNEDDIARTKVEMAKPAYKTRELVKMEVQITDTNNEPLKGNFSVSVTDDKDVLQDTTNNILTTLLLTSELKGYIEDPAYYFRKEDKKTRQDLDILMMTQGWRRYDIDNIFHKPSPLQAYPVEAGPEISGMVKGGLLSKPYEGAIVSIVSMKGHFDVTETDKDGRYYFRNIELPDSTKVIIQALSKKGKNRVELIPDEETYPSITTPWMLPPPEKDNSLFRDYIYKADQKYTYENGFRMIHLDQVEIRAKKEVSNNSLYRSVANNTFTEKQIEESNAIDVFQLLMTVPGVNVIGNSISIRGAKGDPLILIDDVVMEYDYLNMINIHEIEQLNVIKDGSAAIFGMRGGNGVISIYTKSGDFNVGTTRQFNMARLNPLGYHQPAEFYSPRYETPESLQDKKPDLRSTIYWNPNILVDEAGVATIDFFSADSSSPYTITVEGISEKGKIIHCTGKIKRSGDK